MSITMKGKVSQWRKADKQLKEKSYYARGRSFNPLEGNPNHFDIYILENDEIRTLCYNTTKHRAFVLLKAWKDGLLETIPIAIIENYKTNGYNTRTGLFRSINKLERIKIISRSHADYIGHETGNSTLDHKNRQMLRN